MFSSIAGLLGSPAQSNYAAANAGLDAWAHAQRTMGQAGLAIQWGAWASGGMALQDPSTLKRMDRYGMGVLTSDQGLSALQAIMSLMSAHPGVPQCVAGGADGEPV